MVQQEVLGLLVPIVQKDMAVDTCRLPRPNMGYRLARTLLRT